MIPTYKRCAAALSAVVLTLTVPSIALAQTSVAAPSPQEVTIEIVTEYWH